MVAVSEFPDVSVVMPVRNGEQYVVKALRSVLAQKGVDLEVVVVDDGSTDATRPRVEAVGDPRVRIVDGPQQGVAAAMNAGLDAALGRFVARCDSDDVFLPGRLAQQMAFLDEAPHYGAVCGRFETLDDAGRLISRPPAAGERARELTQELRHGTVRVHLCTYLARREAALATGGFRGYFKTGSDIDFQLLLSEQTRVWYEPVARYGYRLHDGSLTHNHTRQLQRFNESMAREFQRQRAERGDPAGRGRLGRRQVFGHDDLQLGHPPERPEVDAAVPEEIRPSAHEQIWQMRWGEAWREHSAGSRTRALRLGTAAALQRPLRPASWRGVAALVVKSVPLPVPRPAARRFSPTLPAAQA